jgi:hypothetical protein
MRNPVCERYRNPNRGRADPPAGGSSARELVAPDRDQLAPAAKISQRWRELGGFDSLLDG